MEWTILLRIVNAAGYRLEFLDAESATTFEECRSLVVQLAMNVISEELCRLTVWREFDMRLNQVIEMCKCR